MKKNFIITLAVLLGVQNVQAITLFDEDKRSESTTRASDCLEVCKIVSIHDGGQVDQGTGFFVETPAGHRAVVTAGHVAHVMRGLVSIFSAKGKFMRYDSINVGAPIVHPAFNPKSPKDPKTLAFDIGILPIGPQYNLGDIQPFKLDPNDGNPKGIIAQLISDAAVGKGIVVGVGPSRPVIEENGRKTFGEIPKARPKEFKCLSMDCCFAYHPQVASLVNSLDAVDFQEKSEYSPLNPEAWDVYSQFLLIQDADIDLLLGGQTEPGDSGAPLYAWSENFKEQRQLIGIAILADLAQPGKRKKSYFAPWALHEKWVSDTIDTEVARLWGTSSASSSGSAGASSSTSVQ